MSANALGQHRGLPASQAGLRDRSVTPRALVLLLALVGSSAAAAPISISLPNLTLVGDFDRAKAGAYADFFAQRLEQTKQWRVTTAAQIAQVLGMERERQLLGCGDGSCTAELAAALGSEAVIIGSLGKIGSAFTPNLRLIDARTGATVASASDRVATEDGLFEWFERTAMAFTTQAVARFRPPAPEAGMRLVPGVVTLGGAAALAAVGTVLLGMSEAEATHIRTQQPPFSSNAELNEAAARGQRLQAGGAGVLVASGVAGVVGVVLLVVLKQPAAPAASIRLVPGGTLVVMEWAL